MRAASFGAIGLMALCQAYAGPGLNGVWVLDRQSSVVDHQPGRLILRLESTGSREVSVCQIRIDGARRRVQHRAFTIDSISPGVADAEVAPARLVFRARSARALEEWTVVPDRRLIISRAVTGSRPARPERLEFKPAFPVPYNPGP